jgi:molybdopterin synthase catalytic subunit
MPVIALKDHPFDPYQELTAFRTVQGGKAAKYGAQSIFIGTMRDFNEGETVERLWLEHYPGMTERELARIVEQAFARWAMDEALVMHRVGEIKPADAIVLIAFWSAHRGAALDATRFVIEELKHRAPFWKKETLGRGTRWVERNTPA